MKVIEMMTKRKWPDGPWAWYGNPLENRMYLATSGRETVMGFDRWGMHGAQPTFIKDRRITKAEDMVTFEVGDRGVVGLKAGDPSVYRMDINGIDHPVACLLEAAPDLYEALMQVLVGIEADETAHGRRFGCGNVARAAIAKARRGL